MTSVNLEGPLNQNVVNVYDRLPIGGEFQGYNGDCTEFSYGVAVQACQPGRVLTRAELDRLTAEAINAGQAAAGGAMTAANLAWLCQREETPYQQSDGSQWEHVLGTQGGYGTWPLILQLANGQALPGNQQGVLGHAVVVLAWDGGQQRATIANGDSANGEAGQLDVVSFQDIRNAQPFSVTEVRLPRPTPPPLPPARLFVNGVETSNPATIQAR